MAMPYISSYDPKKVNITLDGKAITGFAKDGVINVKKNEDNAVPVVGCKGDIIYAENANNSGTIEIPLMQTSAALAYIRQLCESKKYIRTVVVDSNDDDGVQLACEKCRILKLPDLPRNKEEATVTVSIFVPQLFYNT